LVDSWDVTYRKAQRPDGGDPRYEPSAPDKPQTQYLGELLVFEISGLRKVLGSKGAFTLLILDYRHGVIIRS